MAFTSTQIALSSGVSAQIAISTSARRSLYMMAIGGTAWLNPSSSLAAAAGFPISSANGPFRLDGAQASDAVWAISTAAGVTVAAYLRS